MLCKEEKVCIKNSMKKTKILFKIKVKKKI